MSPTLKELEMEINEVERYTNEEMEQKLGKIHNIDCLEFMRKVPDDYFDLVLTDIPYEECDIENNGLWTKAWDNMEKADKKTFDIEIFLKEIDRICCGSFYIFCGIEQISTITKYFKKKHTTRLIIWEKTNPTPINAEYVFLSGIESCVWAKKGGSTFNEFFKNTVFKYPKGEDKTDHPTTKPINLFKEFIRISTNEGNKIFDPCIGSGTTAIASQSLGRKWCGCELEPDYIEIANKRLSKVQLSLF